MINKDLYSSSFISFLATIGALLASTHIHDNFYTEYPIIFWTSQIVIIVVIAGGIILYLLNKYSPLSHHRLLLSISIYIAIYLIAWLNFPYAELIITIIGVTECYTLQKKHH